MKKDFKSVDEYIASQPESIRETLELLRQTIRKAAPEAEEVISYAMPAYKYKGIVAYFAAFKNHYSLFALPKTNEIFKDRLKPYEVSKGTIRFTLETKVPVRLITDIIKMRVKENQEKELLKQILKKKMTGK